MALNRNFKGIWIPKERVDRYGWRRAILLSMYFSNIPMNKRDLATVRKILDGNKNPTEIKNKILTKKGSLKCEWCNENCFCIEEHHYPITKKDGGIKKIKICGKCHSDFHFVNNIEGNT